jgi:hypothetical protein
MTTPGAQVSGSNISPTSRLLSRENAQAQRGKMTRLIKSNPSALTRHQTQSKASLRDSATPREKHWARDAKLTLSKAVKEIHENREA